MYIKYLDNIHKVGKFYSIEKGSGDKNSITGKNENNCIYLQKEDSHFAMKFYNEESRDFILKKIWEELSAGTKCFDLDDFVNTYYISKNYNL